MPPEDSDTLPISKPRLRRLREIFFDLAGGESERLRSFAITDDDEFADLERIALAFFDEFLAAKAHARELEARNREVLGRQAELIESLTAPVISLGPQVVAVPIIGALERGRMERLSAALLERIVGDEIRYVLVDLSGATEIGAESLRDLAQLERAVGLLGAEYVITGISPALAARITELGVEVRARSYRTLGAGLSYCLGAG